MRWITAILALTALPALAGPSCPVTETCKQANDNCQPAEGLLVLTVLEADPVLKGAMGPDLAAAYLAHKRFEVEQMAAHVDNDARCAAYAEFY